MNDEAPWLSAEDERLWRDWLHLNALLPGALHRGLQSDAGLSLPDFDVLVQLTDRPDGRIRVSGLATALSWDRSRLSHHVRRMERRGLVEREECADDGRGAYVVITSQGHAAIEAAAPGHVRTVRRLVFDVLDPGEVAVLRGVVSKLLVGLDGEIDTVSAAGRSPVE